MPVIGTPIDQPVTSTTDCEAQGTIAPEVTRVDGIANPSRKQAISVNQGQTNRIQWVMRNQAGEPVDLVGCGFTDNSSSSSYSSSGSDPDHTLRLRILESMAGSNCVPTEIDAVTVNASAGIVEAQLNSVVVGKAGIYLMEWALLKSDGTPLFSNQGYLIVNRGLFGTDNRQQGPPSISEIRLHMRDSGPEDNYLLDAVEFDLAELAACMERPITVWNTTLEFVGRRHTTQSFPYRAQWLDAICGYLYLMAAHHYRRNRQAYTAGGTAMDDKNKAQEYEAKGRELVAEYKNFVKVRKGQINLEGAFGGTSERS